MMEPINSESHILELLCASGGSPHIETLTPHLTTLSWRATRPDHRGGLPNVLVIKARWMISPKVAIPYFSMNSLGKHLMVVHLLHLADIISTVEFDHTGDYLATGDKGGRVVLFERNESVRVDYSPHEIDSHDCIVSAEKGLRVQVLH